MEETTMCINCGWKGHDTECPVKHFGAYCGSDAWENYGWEEWDDLVCPICNSANLEFKTNSDDTLV